MQVRNDVTNNSSRRQTDTALYHNSETGSETAITTNRHYVVPIDEPGAGREVAEMRPIRNDANTDPM